MALEVGGGSSDATRSTRTAATQDAAPAAPAKKAETAAPAATANPVEKKPASQETVRSARAAFQGSTSAIQNALNPPAPTATPSGDTPPGGAEPEKPQEFAGVVKCPRGGGKCTAGNYPTRGLGGGNNNGGTMLA